MIKSKKDYLYYLEADRIAKAIPKKNSIIQKIKFLLFPNYVWIFQKTLRKLEYYKNCKSGLLAVINRFFIYRKFKRLSYKLGFSIPPNIFGPGLSIAHHGTIIVNGATKVGNNCRLHACVNIGSQAGYGSKAPNLGNNCYIGPGAKIFGEIIISDNVAIGANSVVNKSFSENNIAIGGVPAKKIADLDNYDILIPATEIIEKKLTSVIESILIKSSSNLTQEIHNKLNNQKSL